MVNPTGYTALDLIGYTDKGAYAANVNYVKNDLVHYGGNIWRILIDDTIGITPAEGTNYTLFIGEPTNLIERIIAPLEDNPATVAYQTGRQIIYNNYLYEVVKNIAVGDILVAYEDDPTNANIKLASPVETQVLALNTSKVNKNDVVNNVTTTTAGKVLDARQGKALQDGINTKVNKSDIANNVTTTAEGKVLDARQGKALQDGKTDNSVIAPVESGTTASRAYAAGAHFIKNNAFCTAKTAIAQGETFTLNTNYTAEDIGSVISALNSKISMHGTAVTLYNRNANNFAEQAISISDYRYILLTISWYDGILSTILLPCNLISSSVSSHRLSGYVDTASNLVEVSISLSNTSVLSKLWINSGNLNLAGIQAKIYGIK